MVGQTIGSYSILRQLGAGAMGEVYLAEHRHLKRKAALKMLAPGLVGRPDLLERFFFEARATSLIAHVGIVQIFDCEVDPTGRPYIVMEYLEGDTLAATLAKRGPLPPGVVARVARSIAEALGAAHAKGIVHRDLKPENVFVGGEPPEAVKLVDFGIAKLAGDFRAGQMHQTRTGAMMGTPLYMSPEQCRDSAKIDERTDAYSLGCVMFEMLTGRPPFTQAALGELIVAHMTEQPPDIRSLNGAVPSSIVELTTDLLKKDPAERPNMRQVADRLASFIGRLTTTPGPLAEGLAAAPTMAAPAAAATPARTSQPSVPPAMKGTTLGETASELTAPAPVPRGKLVVAGAIAVAVLAGAGVLVFRAGASRNVGTVSPASGSAAPTAARPAAATPTLPRPAAPVAPAAGGAPTAAAVPARREPHEKRVPPGMRKAAVRKGADATPAAGPAVAPPVETSPGATAAASPATPAAPPAAAPAAAPRLYEDNPVGAWEGPWVDPGRQQKGRLMLQIGADGSASGWMTNAAAKQSYRMVGRLNPGGALDLACQCPREQAFWARGSIHVAGGELKGQLSLLGAAGVFGQGQLTLRHSAAR